MDYVIDAEKMGRTRLAEAEKAEKTIFGMKVEAYLGHEFGLDRGNKLDFYVADVEFDSKATIGKTWMIPPEAFGEIC
ncbi:MAG: NaeI family type II restriction endonuclease, partial [Cyanobacteria bacterium P01_F01_bin.86]